MKEELYKQAKNCYQLPLFQLIFESHNVHKLYHDPSDIQKCTLLSIKTGGCPEDCHYCPQSVHYNVVENQKLLDLTEVKRAAIDAKEMGATRFCMGAAWRSVKNGPDFEKICQMVTLVKNLGLEVCVTLGMMSLEQAKKLKTAGVYAYNHNLDTSRHYYPNIITTRTYDDRLKTLKNARDAGMTICSGGIIGMGETIEDRLAMIAELAELEPQPESVPLNILIPVKNTPLENSNPVSSVELIRLISVTRMLIPKARIRLSAGRQSLNLETQLLAFYAGANSIHFGEKLLTQKNCAIDFDDKLFNYIAG